jgi:methyl-accepting chemotaxis protein
MTQQSASQPLFISVRLSLLIILGMLFAAIVTGLFFWFYRFATELMMDSLRRDLIAIASSTAAGIDGDKHSELFQRGALDDAAYTEINNLLRAIKRNNAKAFSVYTYVQLPDEPDRVRFVVTDELPPGAQLTESEKIMEGSRQCVLDLPGRTQIGEVFTRGEGLTDTMLAGLSAPIAETDVVTDVWGQWLSGYAPIHNAAGQTVGAVGVDMCAADVEQLQNGLRFAILPAFGLTLLFLTAAVVLLANRFTWPVITLTKMADRVSAGDYGVDLTILHSGQIQNEVSTLARVFELLIRTVRQREESLRAQVKELQIIIDDSKRKKQVDEIVDSDFFRDLQGKAKTMRARKDKNEPPGSPAAES